MLQYNCRYNFNWSKIFIYNRRKWESNFGWFWFEKWSPLIDYKDGAHRKRGGLRDWGVKVKNNFTQRLKMKTYDIFCKSLEDSHFYRVCRPVATRVLPPSSLSRPWRKRVPAGDHWRWLDPTNGIRLYTCGVVTRGVGQLRRLGETSRWRGETRGGRWMGGRW